MTDDTINTNDINAAPKPIRLEFCKACEKWYRKDCAWTHNRTKKHKLASSFSKEMLKNIFK